MARRNEEDITRLYMSNAYVTKPQYDDSGNQIGVVPVDYASKDWDKQVNVMLKALQSATNGLARVTSKVDEFGNALATFDIPSNMSQPANASFEHTLTEMETKYGYTQGSLALDPYMNGVSESEKFKRIQFHKDMHGSLAKSRAKRALEKAGGSAEEDPSKAHPDRMRMSFDVPEAEWNTAVQNMGGDVSKARQSFIRKFSSANLKEAEGYSKLISDKKREEAEEKEQKQRERDEKAEKSESKTNRRKMFRRLGTVAAVLTAVADITRRILTAVLSRASVVRQESGDAKKLGISYSDIREYKAQEQSMGLRSGIFTSAIGSLQSAFGDITNLDEGALSELAKVLQGNVIEAINQGLGKSDPQKLLGLILDTYYKRGEQGINSIGQNVGRYQAERELSTALEKAGLTDVADILRNMFYTNDTGIYRGRIDVDKAFQSYMNLVTAYNNGLNEVDYQRASELGQVVDDLKRKFNELKENLETGLLLALGNVIDKINNFRVGQSPEDNLITTLSNRELNERASARMSELENFSANVYTESFKRAGIDFSKFGISGVATAEQFINYLDSKNQTTWTPDTNNPEQVKLLQFLNTPEGLVALQAINSSLTGKLLKDEADRAISTGRQTGQINYNQSRYTDSGLNAAFTQVRDKNFSVRGQLSNAVYNYLSRQGARTNAEEFNRDLAWSFYVDAFGNLTWQQVKALRSGDKKDLVAALVQKALTEVAKYGTSSNMYTTLQQLRSQNKSEELIDKAFDFGLLGDLDVQNLAKNNINYYDDQQGWGLTSQARTVVTRAMAQNTSRLDQYNTAAFDIASQALQAETIQTWLRGLTLSDWERQRAQGYAEVSGYNQQEHTVNVNLVIKDTSGNKLVSKSITVPYDAPVEGINTSVPLPSLIRGQAGSNSTTAPGGS